MNDVAKEFCRLNAPFTTRRRCIGFDARKQGLDFAVVGLRGFEIAQCEDKDTAEFVAQALTDAANDKLSD